MANVYKNIQATHYFIKRELMIAMYTSPDGNHFVLLKQLESYNIHSGVL